ncbi:phytase [Streptomyces antimycoticus]|uniref:phytase n=1 Tax=Streptomyces antimycoticus TaxID=68175 RepID=UPI003F4DAEE9
MSSLPWRRTVAPEPVFSQRRPRLTALVRTSLFRDVPYRRRGPRACQYLLGQRERAPATARQGDGDPGPPRPGARPAQLRDLVAFVIPSIRFLRNPHICSASSFLLRSNVGALALSALTALTTAFTLATGPVAPVTVTATVETPAVYDDEAGGNADADDPAVWVDPDTPGRSIVIGTVKEAGLDVCGLDGRRLQRIAAPQAPGENAKPGRINNVVWTPSRRPDSASAAGHLEGGRTPRPAP